MMMTIELTKEMIFAIKVALDELDNSGEWCNHLSEKESNSVFKGKEQLRSILDK